MSREARLILHWKNLGNFRSDFSTFWLGDLKISYICPGVVDVLSRKDIYVKMISTLKVQKSLSFLFIRDNLEKKIDMYCFKSMKIAYVKELQ